MMLLVFCLQHCVNGHLTRVLKLTLIDSLLKLIANLGSSFWVGLSANHVTLLTSQNLLITVRTTRHLKGSVGVHTHTFARIGMMKCSHQHTWLFVWRFNCGKGLAVKIQILLPPILITQRDCWYRDDILTVRFCF